MLQDINLFWSIAFAAFLVEAVVNIIKNIESKNSDWRYWASLAVGLVVAVLVAINYDLDFFALVGLEGRIPFVGAVLTGLVIGRGSNIVSDVIGRINSWKAPGV